MMKKVLGVMLSLALIMQIIGGFKPVSTYADDDNACNKLIS